MSLASAHRSDSAARGPQRHTYTTGTPNITQNMIKSNHECCNDKNLEWTLALQRLRFTTSTRYHNRPSPTDAYFGAGSRHAAYAGRPIPSAKAAFPKSLYAIYVQDARSKGTRIPVPRNVTHIFTFSTIITIIHNLYFEFLWHKFNHAMAATCGPCLMHHASSRHVGPCNRQSGTN